MNNGALGAALAYAARGWPVFPCKGKKPLTEHGCKSATTDPATIRQLWKRAPASNIGLATGEASSVWVLDIDGPAGEATLAALEAAHGALPRTVIGLTGGGGRHLLFRYHGEPIKNRAGDIGAGLDVRATGGYIIVPPSIHPETRAAYQWDSGLHPESTDIADAPDWLIDLVTGKTRGQRERAKGERPMGGGAQTRAPGNRYAEAALNGECRAVAQTTAGGRNARLNKAAFNLGQLIGGGELERGQVERALFEAAAACGLVADDGESQTMATIKSGLDRGMDDPRARPEPEPKAFRNGKANGHTRHQASPEDRPAEPAAAAAIEVNEDAIALEFANRHADKLRYCHDWGMWLHWDGARWQRERRRLAFHYAREVAREANWEAKAGPAKANTAAGVERFAQADPRLATVSDEWDVDPWKLGTPGGTVDLRTGELMPARPADHITKQTAVAPADPLHGDDCPMWMDFLHQATNGDKDLQRFLQQMAGYCLTGDVSEEALFFVYGPGGNGKGVFLGTLGNILGDYATSAAMDTFTASHGDKHPTDLAKLRGSRMVTASETEEGRPWAEARIKELTGNERPISARFMRQDFFEYMPTFKLLFVGNYKPVLRNVDAAAKRRFNIIPFVHKPENPDTGMKEKLRAEYPAILRWMIDGCLDWKRNGLIRPSVVLEATETYFQEQDKLGNWLEECCRVERDNRHLFETSAKLYDSWKEFSARNGEEAGTSTSFGETLTKHGFGKERKKLFGKTTVVRTGITIIQPSGYESELP